MLIAQISDTHISTAHPAGLPNTSVARLEKAIAHLVALPARPELVLVSGDCVDRGTREEYELFAAAIQRLPMPVHVIPGNHDHRGVMLEIFGAQGTSSMTEYVQYAVDHGPVRIVALDTHLPDAPGGYLCDQRLQWLETTLGEAPDRPTLIMMHHPPFHIGITPFDEIALSNISDFIAVIQRHRQIGRIITGHIHQSVTARCGDVVAMSCASIGETLLADLTKPSVVEVLMEPPSCLLHSWSEATGFLSFTSLIGDHGPVVRLHDGSRWVG